jgi:predicted AlkP superfamily pyrophosphatase or phosphodiesterase
MTASSRRRFSLRSWPVSIPFVLALVGVLPPGAGPKEPAQPARPRLAVLVVFDQMRGDYLGRWQTLFGKGGFARLCKEGTWFQNCHYPYANTVTAAGHASLGTGTSPVRHGIIANEWYDREAGKEILSIESPRHQPVPPAQGGKGKKPAYGAAPVRLLLPTLGDSVKQATGGQGRVIGLSLKDRAAILPAGKKADACYWFSSSAGAFVTSTYYREKLHPWVADYNRSRPGDAWFGRDWQRLLPNLDYARHSGPDDVPSEWTGYHQGRTFPHPMTGGLKKPGKAYYQALVNSPFGNDLLLGLVKRAVTAERLGQRGVPDLLTVSFSSNDLVGHSWGPDSQEVLDVTLRADRLMKDLLDFLDAQVGRGRYVLALSADHGICPIPEVARARGKDALRISPALLTAGANDFLNRTFLPKGKPAAWIEAASPPWIYLNRAALKGHQLDSARVEEALARWLARQPGIQAAYTRNQQSRPRPRTDDPIGDRVRRSYYPGRSGEVAVVLKPYYLMTRLMTGTTHGSPHAYDTHVPLLVYGPGIRARVRRDAVTPQAAVVILAHALGIKPPAGAEAPLPEGVFGMQ